MSILGENSFVCCKDKNAFQWETHRPLVSRRHDGLYLYRAKASTAAGLLHCAGGGQTAQGPVQVGRGEADRVGWDSADLDLIVIGNT